MATTISEKNDNILFKGGQVVSWDWESDTGGEVTSQTLYPYNGIPVQAVFVPDSDTGTVPTTGYDVTITDENSVDILSGNGANLTSTGTVYKHPSDGVGLVVYSKLTLNVSGAGESKGGKVHLYLAA